MLKPTTLAFLSAILVAWPTACACTQETKNTSEIPAPLKASGDGLGTPVGDMCKHLRDLGCSDGFPKTKNGKTRTCYEALSLAQMPLPAECVTRAASISVVRACGDPTREITFRCPDYVGP